MIVSTKFKKGLSFISNRQRRREGTFSASELAGIEPTPTRPRRAGYARLKLSSTGGHNLGYGGQINDCFHKIQVLTTKLNFLPGAALQERF